MAPILACEICQRSIEYFGTGPRPRFCYDHKPYKLRARRDDHTQRAAEGNPELTAHLKQLDRSELLGYVQAVLDHHLHGTRHP